MSRRDSLRFAGARMRRAAGPSACLALLEVGVASFVGALVELPIARETSALLDPGRVLAALVELDAKALTALASPLAIVGLAFLFYVIVEPLLEVAYVRAHAIRFERSAGDAAPSSTLAAALALVGTRIALGVVVAVALGLLAGAMTLVAVATHAAADPRLRDIPIAALALAMAAVAWLGYVALELATVRIALGAPRPLEASLGALRSLAPSGVVVRLLLALASLGVAWSSVALTAATSDASGLAAALGSFVVLVGATGARVGLRSAWLGYAVEAQRPSGR